MREILFDNIVTAYITKDRFEMIRAVLIEDVGEMVRLGVLRHASFPDIHFNESKGWVYEDDTLRYTAVFKPCPNSDSVEWKRYMSIKKKG